MTAPRAGGRPPAVLALLVTALLLLAGCASLAPAGPPAGPTGTVEWTPCGQGFDCATVPVPLVPRVHAGPGDHDEIEIALIRLPAGRPEARRGSLLVNPGGPGGSGVDFVRGAAEEYFDEEVRDVFDVVGFDPRGVGRSTGVDCDGALTPPEDVPFPPRTDAERATLESGLREAVAACVDRTGELVHHMTTEAAAHDLDVLREALGEDLLTYHGISYGTFLGTTYAALHPDRVRAMVLDAPLDPGSWQAGDDQLARESTAGFHQALRSFFDACRRDTGSCSFGAGDPEAAYDRLVRSVAQRHATGEDTLDAHTVVNATAGALYDDGAWPWLADALARAERGDTSRLRATLPEGDGGVGDAFFAVRCSDRTTPPSFGATEALARELQAIDRHFGPLLAYQDAPCAFWPAPRVRFTGPYTAEGAPPILVVGTTGDPATPIGHARALAEEIRSAALVVREGDGHGAYGRDEACVDTAVNSYLLDLTVPAPGLTCRA